MSETYEKPQPVIDPGTRPFWDAAREPRLSIQRCRACVQNHFYPRELCPHCHSIFFFFFNDTATAEIYTYTIARKPAGPVFAADVPYVIALIALDEGPRMLTNIVTNDVEQVRIGDRVTVKFDDVTPELTLPKFTLDKD